MLIYFTKVLFKNDYVKIERTAMKNMKTLHISPNNRINT